MGTYLCLAQERQPELSREVNQTMVGICKIFLFPRRSTITDLSTIKLGITAQMQQRKLPILPHK